MHIFSQASLDRFLARAGGFYAVRREGVPIVILSRAELPETPSILVLAANRDRP